MRLDLYLSEIKNISRNKASELIKGGFVLVDGKVVKKPSFVVDIQEITLNKKDFYVSRAGEKLAGFLKNYKLDIKNKICLDIGSSTGGFVQVLLEHGAREVVAVDVGKEQLHKSLRTNPKIKLHEQTDIRDFVFDGRADLITCDVSFISFKDVFDSIDKFASKHIIILFKPQFEVGREVKRNSNGVVCDDKAIQKAMDEFERLALTRWDLLNKQASQVKGKEGNLESFYVFAKR